MQKIQRGFKKPDSENETPQLAIEKTRNETFSQTTFKNIQNASREGELYDIFL